MLDVEFCLLQISTHKQIQCYLCLRRLLLLLLNQEDKLGVWSLLNGKKNLTQRQDISCKIFPNFLNNSQELELNA